MSTDLYRIRVLGLDPGQRKLSLRVFLVYYEWEGVPTDPSFFCRILWDEGDTRFGGGGPIGDEISVDQICDEKWVDANTHRFIERVTKLSRRNDPLPKGESRPTFVYEGFKDESVLTQGDYEVIVTDAKWMQHLKVDQWWQTTSYETRAKMPPGRETRLLDVPQADEASKSLLGKGSPVKTGAKKAAKPSPVKKGAKKAAKVSPVKKGAKKAAKGSPVKKVAKAAKASPVKKGAKKAAKVSPAKKVAKVAKVSPVKKVAKAAKGSPVKKVAKVAKAAVKKVAKKMTKAPAKKAAKRK